MELEQAIDLINTALVAQEGKSLTDTEVAIVTGAWQGQTYSAIATASGYTLSYLSTDIGPVFWRRLSQALGEKVSKTNFRSAIERHGRQEERMKDEGGRIKVSHSSTHPPIHSSTHTDWGEAIDVSLFYGRIEELHKLQQWTIAHCCRLIAVLGMGGIGKTSLAVKLAQQIEPKFEYVIWRSLRNAPPLDTLLNELISFLSDQEDTQTTIGRLLHWLRTHRCLVILDNLETILQPGDRAGQYREGFENYGDLLQTVGETAHQSCLIFTSREKPAEIAALEGIDFPVRSLQLAGSVEVSQAMLQAKGLTGTDQAQQVLCDRYGSNPLALKIIASTIQELFDGDIQQFLQQDAIVFNSVRRLLEQQFERLSELERSVMIWLAINREWTAIAELAEDIVPLVSRTELLEALESLCWRGLIEKRAGSYTQQPVVMEYVCDRLVERIALELKTAELTLFLHHALIKITAKEYIRESQVRVILRPIATQFSKTFSSRAALEQQVLRILMSLRQTEVKLSGYGAGNLINLCVNLQLTLAGFSFAGLTIRHAFFPSNLLQCTDFTNANIQRTLFVQTFGCVFSTRFSSDGQWLAVGGNGRIYLWKVKGSEQFFALEGHSNQINSVAFSPDGNVLVSGGCDQTIRLWDVANRQLIRTLSGHTHPIWSVAVSPDQQMIASGSEDNTIRLWHLSTGTSRLLEGHHSWVTSIAFNPSDKTLVSAGLDGVIKVWDLETNQALKSFQAHAKGEIAIAISPDGKYLASGSLDQTVKIWNLPMGQLVQTFRDEGAISSVAFSPDGQTLLSGNHNKELKLWNLATAQVAKVLRGHPSWVTTAYSPDGKTIASGSFDRTICLWDAATGQQIKTLTGYANGVQALQFIPHTAVKLASFEVTDLSIGKSSQCHSQLLVSGGADSTLRFWDLNSQCVVSTLHGHTQPICSIALSPSGHYLATGGDDQSIRLWELDSGQVSKVLLGHTGWVRSVTFFPLLDQASLHPMGILASAASDHTIRIWDVATGQSINVLSKHTDWVNSVTFSPDGHLLASGSADRTIQIWNTKAWKIINVLAGHSNWVWNIAFNPNGRLLASSSEDHTIRLWDALTGELIYCLEDHSDSVVVVAFDPTGRFLASGSFDKTVKLWDVQTGQILHTFAEHTARILSLTFDATGHVLVSGAKDGTILLWNICTGKCLKTLKADRPYENMNITGVLGLTEVQKASLRALGAIEH